MCWRVSSASKPIVVVRPLASIGRLRVRTAEALIWKSLSLRSSAALTTTVGLEAAQVCSACALAVATLAQQEQATQAAHVPMKSTLSLMRV